MGETYNIYVGNKKYFKFVITTPELMCHFEVDGRLFQYKCS